MTFSFELQHIDFSYGDHPILRGVDLSISPGEVVGLVGAPGAGKSTLLKVAAGLLEPAAGTTKINHLAFWSLAPHEQADLRSRIGFFFQEPALISNMTIYNNLALPLRYHHGWKEEEIGKRIRGWLEALHLSRYEQKLPAALSMGLRRQVGFIRAMMVDAKLLIWDEPIEGLAAGFVQQIAATISERKKLGVASLVATHDRAFLSRIADRSFELVDGKISPLFARAE